MNARDFLARLGDPETCARSLWERIPGYIRWTFFAAVISGFAVHLFVFTNKFLNNDDVDQMFSAVYGTASGRWLLPVVAGMDGDFSVPWLIGVLGVLCLAVTACLTVSALRIRRPVACVLTAAVLVAFPPVASAFAYMFTADAYLLSLLLAVFGAWAAVRWKWAGIALGAVSLALSLGIYQAYFPAAAALMVGALLLEVLDGEKSFKELLLEGVRLVGTLAAGLAVYMGMVRLTTWKTGLTRYQGLDRMGLPPLEEIPELLQKAYGKYPTFFLENDENWHFEFLNVLFILGAVGAVALLAAVLWRRRLGVTRTILAVVLVALYPLAADLIYLMVPNGFMHSLMIYALVYILVLPIALVEYGQPIFQGLGERTFHTAVSWVVCLCVALSAYSYAIADNNAYLKAELVISQCEAYSTRLLERIETCEGYEPWLSVVLVGSNKIDRATFSATPELDAITVGGVFDVATLRSFFSYPSYLRKFLGFSAPVYWGNSKEGQDVAKLEEVQKMPIYPREGSVRVISDVIVVKMG